MKRKAGDLGPVSVLPVLPLNEVVLGLNEEPWLLLDTFLSGCWPIMSPPVERSSHQFHQTQAHFDFSAKLWRLSGVGTPPAMEYNSIVGASISSPGPDGIICDTRSSGCSKCRGSDKHLLYESHLQGLCKEETGNSWGTPKATHGVTWWSQRQPCLLLWRGLKWILSHLLFMLHDLRTPPQSWHIVFWFFDMNFLKSCLLVHILELALRCALFLWG